MTGRKAAAVAVSAILVAAGGWWSVETAAAGSRSAAAGAEGSEVRTIRLLTHEDKARVVELRGPFDGELRPGDLYIAEGRVFNRSHSERIGSYATQCVFGISTIDCDNTMSLSGRGRIHLTGTIQLGELDFESGHVVIGGTGRFSGISGDATTGGEGTPHPNKDQWWVLKVED
jgi:hypothetical protein